MNWTWSIPSPNRFPEIKPLDFFCCGSVKDMVYRNKVLDIIDLQHRLTRATAAVTVDMLARTWQEFDHLLNILGETGGTHVELY